MPNDYLDLAPDLPMTNDAFATLLQTCGIPPSTMVALSAYYAVPPSTPDGCQANGFRTGLVRLVTALLPPCAEKALILTHLQTLATLQFNNNHDYFCQSLSTFNDNQIITLAYCLADMAAYMRSRGLDATLTSALNMGPVALYTSVDYPALQKTAVTRMQNLHIFLHELIQLPLYRQLLTPGEQYWLEPSGSDAHLGNRQVIFCIAHSDSGNRHVFKPRCMKPDLAVSKCIDAFDQIMPSACALYAPKIFSNATHSIGAMEWITPMPTMTMAQAQRYYTQMGALIFLSKLIGLTDLHQDNIFPTSRGPVIVDAECAFSPPVLHSTNLFDTLLSMALLESDGDDGTARAVFLVEDPANQNKFAPSTELLRAGHFTNEILGGFQLAVKHCQTHWAQLSTSLTAACAAIEEMRYVPLQTSAFYALAAARLGRLNISDTSEFKRLVNTLQPFRLVEDTALWQEGLQSALEFSFDNGDIPYVTIDLHSGSIRCCGLQIGSMVHFTRRPIREVLSDTLAFLISPIALTQLRDFLPPPALKPEAEPEPEPEL